MKRTLKILRLVLFAGVFLFAAAAALYVFVLPGIVESEIRKALADLGFPDAEFEVRGVSLSGLQLRDLCLRPDARLTADSVDVEFDLGTLREGRVRAVYLTGVHWIVAIRGGEIDLGPIDDIVTGDSEDDEAAPLPFDRIELRSSTITVVEGDRDFHIPLEGSVRESAPGSIEASLRTRLLDRAARIDGTVDSATGGIVARIDADPSSVRLRYAPSGESDRLGAELLVRESGLDRIVEGHRVRVDSLMLTGPLELEGFGSVTALGVKARLEGLVVDGETVGDLRFGADLDGAEVHWSVAAGSPGSTSARLAGRAPRDLEALSAPAQSRAFEFEIEGPLSNRLLDLLSDAGVEIAMPASLGAKGSAVLDVEEGGWRIADLAASLSFDTAAISLPGESLDLPATGGVLQLSGSASPAGLDLSVETGSIRVGRTPDAPLYAAGFTKPGRILRRAGYFEVGFPELSVQAAEGAADLFAKGLAWKDLAGTVNLGVTIKPDMTTGNVGFEAGGPFIASVGGVEGRFETFKAEMEVLTTVGGLDWARGRVSFKAPRIRAGADLEILEATTSLPILLGASFQEQGEISAKELRWGERRFPELRAHVVANPERWGFSAGLNLSDSGRLSASGEVDVSGPQVRAGAALAIPAFRAAGDDQVAKILRELSGLSLTGDLSLDGRMDLVDGRLVPDVHIALTGGTVAAPKNGPKIEGVEVALNVDRLSPPRTPGGQIVRWQSGTLGDLKLGEGALTFRIEEPRSVVVESLGWRLGRTAARMGRFWARSFRFDPEKPVIDTEVFLEGLPLSDWLTLIAPEHATGEGEIYGRIPLGIRVKPKLAIQLGSGYLYTGRRVDRGEGALYAETGGRIRVTGTEEMVRKYVPATPDTEDYIDLVRRRIVHALANFDFDTLRFDLLPKRDELGLRVKAAGRGAGVMPGTIGRQELDVTLNFNGVEKLIGPALGLGFTLGPQTGPR